MKDYGGPAFPQGAGEFIGGGQRMTYGPAPGMSLRDWFAGQALVVISQRVLGDDPRVVVADAYRVADAMLAERAKEA